MPSTSPFTSAEDLQRIANERKRGITLDKIEHVWCGGCGMPAGKWGVVHWQDCDASEADIRFKLK